MAAAGTWLDTLTAPLAPRWTLRRMRARIASEMLARHYESASIGRRTAGWTRPSSDANAAVGQGLSLLREQARDLVRNNPFAESALSTIVDHVVGWGITAAPARTTRARARVAAAWKDWAETTACDADGRLDFAGLEKQVTRTVVEAGEVLVRRRWRRPEDELPLPMQLQVLEPDFIDTMKDGVNLDGGGRIIQGIEFDAIGRRRAYWLFPEHPGAASIGVRGIGIGASRRVPATEILHIFKPGRPGQIRAASWFAPVILRLKDFDDYEDAALMKQKIAACLAVITSDIDGTSPALGATDPTKPEQDSLEPGMILNAAPGRTVSVVQPPTISEHAEYAATVLRAIATGLGVAYEDLTGDYGTLSFSAARMSRIRHWDRIHDWRWRMLIPQFCDPAWRWAMEAAAIMGLEETPVAEWTPPPMPMIEPDKEGLAYQRNIRSGIMTLSEAIRERGYDPEVLLDEMADDNRKLDARKLKLDSDGRYMTQAGQLQGAGLPTPVAAPAPSPNGNGTAATAKYPVHAPPEPPAITVNVAPPDVTVNMPPAGPVRRTYERDKEKDLIVGHLDEPVSPGVEP